MTGDGHVPFCGSPGVRSPGPPGGLGLVGTGIAAIFSTNSEAGAATLIGVGSLLVILGA